MDGLEAHIKNILINSRWGIVKKEALDPKYNWGLNPNSILGLMEQPSYQKAMAEMTRSINLDYYNQFERLFDGDFMTKIDFPNKITDQWDYVTVGVMWVLYNSINEEL